MSKLKSPELLKHSVENIKEFERRFKVPLERYVTPYGCFEYLKFIETFSPKSPLEKEDIKFLNSTFKHLNICRKKGIFITFEGMDGCGKSTQARFLKSWLIKTFPDLRNKVLLTKEPGGCENSEAIRSLLLDTKTKIDPLTELFLIMADRSNHVKSLIKPALENQKIVISDRYIDSTVAYQGYGKGIDFQTIADLNMVATNMIVPDITFFITLPLSEVNKRLKERKTKDRFEIEDNKFRSRVYSGYLSHLPRLPRVEILDGTKDIIENQMIIHDWVFQILSAQYFTTNQI